MDNRTFSKKKTSEAKKMPPPAPLYDEVTMGSHPLLCRLVKSVFEQRPSLAQCQETGNVDDVLFYLD